MTVKVTTEIDDYLKKMFEISKNVHRKTYREILEKGIVDILKDIDPVQILKHEIKRKELENEEDRQLIARLEALKILQPEKKPEVNIELEELREELFQKNKESIIRQWERGRIGGNYGINWGWLQNKFEFANEKEASEWLKKRIGR